MKNGLLISVFLLMMPTIGSAKVFAICESTNQEDFKIVFSQKTKENTDWCLKGKGQFAVFYQNQLQVKLDSLWDKCSKRGVYSHASNEAFEVNFSEIDSRGNLGGPVAHLVTSGMDIEFACK